jgi:hypothetical protein
MCEREATVAARLVTERRREAREQADARGRVAVPDGGERALKQRDEAGIGRRARPGEAAAEVQRGARQLVGPARLLGQGGGMAQRVARRARVARPAECLAEGEQQLDGAGAVADTCALDDRERARVVARRLLVPVRRGRVVARAAGVVDRLARRAAPCGEVVVGELGQVRPRVGCVEPLERRRRGEISVPHGVMRIKEERCPRGGGGRSPWRTPAVGDHWCDSRDPVRRRGRRRTGRAIDGPAGSRAGRYGIRTWLMTWMTPLEALTSVLVTWALFT